MPYIQWGTLSDKYPKQELGEDLCHIHSGGRLVTCPQWEMGEERNMAEILLSSPIPHWVHVSLSIPHCVHGRDPPPLPSPTGYISH